MKKIIFLFAAISLVLSACKKEETPDIITISTERKSLMLDFTATWCCPCGNYMPIFEDVQHHFPYKVIPMCIHASNDSFYNASMYNYWATVYNVTGIPTVVSDNREVMWGFVLPDLHLDTSDFYHIIDSTTSLNTPKCGIGIAKTIVGNTMTINTKTAFFNSTTGKLTLAIYITEDKIQTVQNCNTATSFDNIFRVCVNDPSGVGTILVNGPVAKGKVFDNTFTFTIPANYVKDNLHIVAVVYSMGTGLKPLDILNVNKI